MRATMYTDALVLNIHRSVRADLADRPSRSASAVGLGRYALGVRTILFVLGAVAIAWGVFVFPVFWRQSTLEQTWTRIIRDEAYKPESLLALLPLVEEAERAKHCQPTALRSAVGIRLRLVELLSADRSPELDRHVSALGNSVRTSLACAPVDPFLWLTLFWVETGRNGFAPDYAKYLRLSYELGPNEGWIAIRRNRLALGFFEELSPDLADMAVREFAKLLDSGLYNEVLALLLGPGWRLRDTLLAHLDGVAVAHRRNFARILRDGGYPAEVPGFVLPERERPQ